MHHTIIEKIMPTDITQVCTHQDRRLKYALTQTDITQVCTHPDKHHSSMDSPSQTSFKYALAQTDITQVCTHTDQYQSSIQSLRPISLEYSAIVDLTLIQTMHEWRGRPRPSTVPGLGVCEWCPDGLYDKSVSRIPNTDDNNIKIVNKK